MRKAKGRGGKAGWGGDGVGGGTGVHWCGRATHQGHRWPGAARLRAAPPAPLDGAPQHTPGASFLVPQRACHECSGAALQLGMGPIGGKGQTVLRKWD